MPSLPKMNRALLLAMLSLSPWTAVEAQTGPETEPFDLFFQITAQDRELAQRALQRIEAAWQPTYVPLLLDVLRQARRERWPGIVELLERKTGQRFGTDIQAWRRWTWRQPFVSHPEFARFKRELYSFIDPRMRDFFPPGVRSLVRLDEIEWGGVKVNGIPPLDYPKHIAADDARYLGRGDIVFGIYLNGEARAYPKRILAWHELARDRVGGLELTIVYCTLCGTVIPYESVIGGKLRRLGTSGLLYRSNKLLFDEETHSLWSTLEGKPVVGALAGSDLRLRPLPVVTTTWDEWRRDHPHTTVLSLDTGHRRDYAEGAAYRDYFASDDLMFPVSQTDAKSQLRNKDEVLVLRLPGAPGQPPQPVAISAAYLRRNRIYHAQFAGQDLVVLTSPRGANRVYAARGVRFRRYLGDHRVEGASGGVWRIMEDALVPENGAAPRLPRVPAQRAFWFGWYAQFPDTILIK